MRKRINLYGAIGYDWWSDQDNTAARFQRDFAALEADDNCAEIAIHINSPGGEVYEGLAIFNTIAQSKKPTLIVVDGLAASMGAFIAMAGKRSTIAQNGLLMLHNASTISWGNAQELRDTAATLEKHDKALAMSVAGKCGLPVEDVLAKWFDFKDHWMTADEAVENNLIDAVADELADLPSAINKDMPLMKIAAVMGKHLHSEPNFFEKLSAKVAAMINKPVPGARAVDPVNNDVMKISAKFSALLAVFGLVATDENAELEHVPTAEQVEALNASIENGSAAAARVSALEAELAGVVSARDAALAQVAALGGQPAADPTPSGGNDPAPAAPKGELTSWERLAEKKKAMFKG